MERSRMILLGSLGALAVAALSTVAWMASAADKDSSASVGTEPSVSTAVSSWRPAPPKEQARLEPVRETVRSAPEPTQPEAKASPAQKGPTGPMERGSLQIEIKGIQALHDDAVGTDNTPGPITVVLSDPSGEGSSEFASFEAKGMIQTERVALEDVPLGLEYLLSVTYGNQSSPRQLDLRVGGPDSSATKGRITVDLGAKQRAEKAAIGTLRSLAAAQQQLQASAAIDTDADGGGEHGYLAELAGTNGIRAYVGEGVAPTVSAIRLDPAYLPASFGELTPAASGAALIRGGYAYQVYLPAGDAERPVRGIPEDLNGGASLDMPGSSNAELLWCAYAWPLDRHDAPWATLFINQSGDVIKTSGTAIQRYTGLNGGPSFDAVFANPGDMASEPALTAAGLSATDGNKWAPVGN